MRKIVVREFDDICVVMLFEKLLRVIDSEPHGAALNMAIDEALLRSATAPTLRIYRWIRPALSFGYFEKVAALSLPSSDWEMVRRWTGGGVVRHGDDVTYTLVIPAGFELASIPAATSYCLIHECLAMVLAGQGIATQLAAASSPKISNGCFENPAAADVLSAGRKIAGAAQRRTRWGLLHQGSVQGISGNAADFAKHLARAFSTAISERELDSFDLAAAQILAAEKYATDAWLRRF